MNVLLGVCGSISAYKSFDILRGLIKQGHTVRVVCTKGSLNFILPQVFLYLGAQKVYSDEEDFKHPSNDSNSTNSTVLHIELAKWSDSFSIAPLSANTLSNLALASCPDLITSIFLALERDIPVNLFPAMNTLMFSHPFTKENIDLVKKIKNLKQVIFHAPESGLLACGDIGEGKLADPAKIVDRISAIKKLPNAHPKKILIATGATIAPIDPVRYLTNPSSGITGYHLAAKAISCGHKVCIIAGSTAVSKLEHLEDIYGAEVIRVNTTEQMAKEVIERFNDIDVYISPAAISDIKFKTHNKKLKKEDLNRSFEIQNSIDILKEVLKIKKPHQKIIGFAAETELTQEVLERKFRSKPVDLLIGTKVHNGLSFNNEKGINQGFKEDEAFYKFFQDNKVVFEGHLSKKDMAFKAFERVIND